MSMSVRHFWQYKPWLFLSFAMVLLSFLSHVRVLESGVESVSRSSLDVVSRLMCTICCRRALAPAGPHPREGKARPSHQCFAFWLVLPAQQSPP